ncbi:DUF4232 domain-containing protein [Streptomyces sp. SID486]|uniref:DUF4232 domain-containing protein n=1 Tax=unclassified Streptomyces TaxID=2593676 RepID=UPI001371F245|nr:MULTISPECIES: DUF4232 domain-containing protein [unclassified Streptomyces]MYW16538.1 DUF4232 domain-containing protein [Streptomyces sp. SID2955]MYW43618.1 DUF4232 domain-containing protein [Streptomyces sp. SID161]MYX93839.1 DUF4232 domain-containing protein [Streptomyces sp. SID486]
MVYTPRSARRGALLVGSVAVLGLLTACGNGTDVHGSPPVTASGTAAPAQDGKSGSASAPASTPSDSASASVPVAARSSGSPGTPGGGTPPATAPTAATAGGTRCHTSELRASVGRNDPGAGQENFPVVLTNRSGRTCTLRGYPGAAFVNGSGGQLGADPRREPGSPVTVTLRPGQSAWTGLTFSNPGISGARQATPSALLVTPPDERDPLKVAWSGGPVPVAGNASSVRLTVLSPGTGP